MITERVFGHLSDGRPVKLYRIENSHGEYAEICDFGAVIQSVFVPDRDGKLGNAVLSCPNVAEMENKSFKAATIGRVGNRIAYGRCRLHGEDIQLEISEKPNLLHSGSSNWAFKLFSGEVTGENTVTLRHTDMGECGFNDKVEAAVSFTFDDSHRLNIRYEVTPERETVLSPTNHAYFNPGDYCDARDLELTLRASNLAARGPSGTPEGGLVPVEGTPFDFRAGKKLGDDMKKLPLRRKYFDDFYVLDEAHSGAPVASLYSERTGRVINAYTDMQCAIIYTPAGYHYPDASGVKLPRYPAVCIECQFVPNAVNVPEFRSPVFGAGEKLVTETAYEFLVK